MTEQNCLLCARHCAGSVLWIVGVKRWLGYPTASSLCLYPADQMDATVQVCPRCYGNIEKRKKLTQPRTRLGQEKWGQTLEPKLWCVKEHGTFWNGEQVGFMSPWELEGGVHVTFICFNFFLYLFFHFFSFVVPITQLVLPSINYFRKSNVIECWNQ